MSNEQIKKRINSSLTQIVFVDNNSISYCENDRTKVRFLWYYIYKV